MSARAIGISYASCTQDYTFYLFCKDVFYTFLPYAASFDCDAINKMKKYLPGIFKLQDEIPKYLTVLEFPTMNQILQEINHWKGPLPFHPKWNFSHFVNPPTYIPPDYITLASYNVSHNITFTDPPTI